MRRRSLIIVICFLLSLEGLAQSNTLDSLIAIYSQSSNSGRQIIFRALNRYIVENPKQTIQISQLLNQKEVGGDSTYLALVDYTLASAYELLGSYDSATLYIRRSLKHVNDEDFPLLLANGYNLLGIIQDVQGNYELSLQSFFQALNIWEKTDHQEGINTAYINIGNIYAYQNEFASAISYYQKSLTIAREIRDTVGVIMALNNIGSSWQEMDSLDLAMDYYQQAIEVARQRGDEQIIALPLDGISHILLKRGELTEALTNAQYLLEVAKKYQNVNDQIYAYLLLAKVQWARNNLQVAIRTATQGYELAHQSGATLELKEMSKLLSDYHEQQGDYREAYRYRTIQLAYQDSIYSVEKRKIIYDLERTRADTEIEMLQKENELKLSQIARSEAIIDRQLAYTAAISIVLVLLLGGLLLLVRSNMQRKKTNELLSKQKEEIGENNRQLTQMNRVLEQQQQQLQSQNEDLTRLNELKNKLLSIISHDFRSPLSSLQGIISMLNSKVLSSEEIEMVFDTLSVKVQNTTNMLDNLLKWTRNQMQGIRLAPARFSLPTLAEDVINSQIILAEKKEVELHHTISSPLSVYADPEMIRLVLRNLISNAIKFTTKGDKITVEAKRSPENRVIVSVIDTGMGISPENQAKLFQLKDHTTYGTDNEKGTGLGLILCREFVEKNGGEIWVESEEGKGSTFRFSLLTQADEFPVAAQEDMLSTTP
jgi:signal transduction histidine kinase